MTKIGSLTTWWRVLAFLDPRGLRARVGDHDHSPRSIEEPMYQPCDRRPHMTWPSRPRVLSDLLPLLNSGRIVLPRNDRLQGQIVGLERRTARLAGTPSRIPTAATMTWRMRLPARRRSPTSADTTRACAGCRATTTTAAPPGSASVFKPSSTARAHPTMTEFCALSRAESAEHLAQTPAIFGTPIFAGEFRCRHTYANPRGG